MRLNRTDRWFLGVLAPGYRDFLVTRLEERSDYVVSIAAGQMPRSRIATLGTWARLCARALSGWAGEKPSSGCDVVVYEREEVVSDQRQALLARFQPAASVFVVTSRTPVVPPARLGWTLRVLLGTLWALLTYPRGAATDISLDYVGIATACISVAGHTSRAREQSAYLFRLYRRESPVVAAMLLELGLDVHLVPGSTPLAPHLKRLLGTSVKLSTAYQIDEYRVFESLGRCPTWELWGPPELPEMEAAYAGRQLLDHPGRIGIYTQGYWLRDRLGLAAHDALAPHLALEERFVSALADYAASRPDLVFTVFPHPVERRHHRQTTEWGYPDLLVLPNVVVADEGSSSLETFDSVGLGVTTASTVGFDRLHLGFRTIFLVDQEGFVDLSVPSPFGSVMFTDPQEFVAAVDAERTRTHAQFMDAHFDDAYGDVWRPWPQHVPTRSGGAD